MKDNMWKYAILIHSSIIQYVYSNKGTNSRLTWINISSSLGAFDWREGGRVWANSIPIMDSEEDGCDAAVSVLWSEDPATLWRLGRGAKVDSARALWRSLFSPRSPVSAANLPPVIKPTEQFVCMFFNVIKRRSRGGSSRLQSKHKKCNNLLQPATATQC